MAARPRSLVVGTLLVVSALAGCAAMHDEGASQRREATFRNPQLEAARRVKARIEARDAAARRDAITIYLVLKLGERRLYMVNDDYRPETPAVVDSFPVAIGREKYATPLGRFQVTDKVEDPAWIQFDWENPSRAIRTIPPGPDNPLGRRWIGFASAHGWDIGFHGTPRPELLGMAVSHGCVRMRNDDVVKLYDRVSVGTTVIVEP